MYVELLDVRYLQRLDSSSPVVGVMSPGPILHHTMTAVKGREQAVDPPHNIIYLLCSAEPIHPLGLIHL